MKNKKIVSKHKKNIIGQIALHVFFILLCLCYLYPLLLLLTISFEGAENVGFSLAVKEFSTAAYAQIFSNPHKILKAYGVTALFSVASTLGCLVVTAMFAYALSKRDFKYRNILTFLLFFTTLFNGGIVPSYLINTKLLHLNNTIWIYILPTFISAWNVIVVRTFFQGLPEGLNEAARIDGASEFRICFQIIIPLATPALASIGFLHFIGNWNDWYTTSVYIRKPDLYSLQYLLKIILDNEEYLKEIMKEGVISREEVENQVQNLESLRFAMGVVAVGPMAFVFPLFQKYFAKGLTLGSVKG